MLTLEMHIWYILCVLKKLRVEKVNNPFYVIINYLPYLTISLYPLLNTEFRTPAALVQKKCTHKCVPY